MLGKHLSLGTKLEIMASIVASFQTGEKVLSASYLKQECLVPLSLSLRRHQNESSGVHSIGRECRGTRGPGLMGT